MPDAIEHEEQLQALGLDSLAATYPEVVTEAGRAFLAFSWKGRRERIELAPERLRLLAYQTAKAAFEVG